MKNKLIKALDVAGLKVFEPIVRLCYWEEPALQARKIGLYLVIPACVFVVFIGLWAYIGPRHKTKSGEVPGPGRVVDAYGNIVTFHDREYTKLADFERSGEDRETQLAAVEKRLAGLDQLSPKVAAKFSQLEAERAKVLSEKLAPFEKVIADKQTEFDAAAKEREAALSKQSAAISPDDAKAKSDYAAAVQKHLAKSEAEAEQIAELRSDLDEKRTEKYPPLEQVRALRDEIEQERQFLKKRVAYLTTSNKSLKLAAAELKLEELEGQYASATGSDLLALSGKIAKQEKLIETIEESEYAKPPTFFDNIWTSLKCVFAGFLIGTAIAIPIGVLCGLNSVFMAAMTPLVSLFKPVSPIVWLPIVFIIVGGFIDKPDEAWVQPAFLSSAITVALCSLWPTLVNTALGVAAIDKDHLNVARVLKLGFWNRMFKIVIPSALPLIFAGLRISLGVGWMVLIAAELLSSSPGLGKYVWDMFNNGSSETFAQMFVVVFFVGVIGLLLDRMMIVFQRLVTFDGAPTAI